MAASNREFAARVALRLIPAGHRAARWTDIGELGFAVIGTGNHFIFDGLVGAAVCLAALEITDAMHRRGYPTVRRRIRTWSHLGR